MFKRVFLYLPAETSGLMMLRGSIILAVLFYASVVRIDIIFVHMSNFLRGRLKYTLVEFILFSHMCLKLCHCTIHWMLQQRSKENNIYRSYIMLLKRQKY